MGSGSATAHCLKYDSLWWNAYEVSGYQLDYEINIFISYLNRKEIVNEFDVNGTNEIRKRNLEELNWNELNAKEFKEEITKINEKVFENKSDLEKNLRCKSIFSLKNFYFIFKM